MRARKITRERLDELLAEANLCAQLGDLECLPWRPPTKGSTNTAYVLPDGEQVNVRKAAYVATYGGTIPDDHQAHKLCETTACINPLHIGGWSRAGDRPRPSRYGRQP